VTRIVGGVTDITGRKRLEAELLQARKLEAIGRLAGAVAHDFNNLLTVILNCADLLARDYPALRDNEDVLAIGESARRGGDLTRSLLTIGRRQVGLARPVNVATEVLGAQMVLTRALGDRVTLELSHASPAPWVSIDPSQLHLLLLNLALNARDAMPDGGVFRLSIDRVAAGASGLPVELSSDHEYAVIQASDTGTGIDPDVMPQLFEPFFTTKNDGKSNGLGLATCLGIARSAGGTIAAESRANGGATFRVYLPVTSALGSSSLAPVLSSRGGRETVLVVEDVSSLRALVARDLRGRGYTVVGAGSAEEALELLALRDGLVELALIDIGLPGMPGTALAAKLRIERPSMKLVLMSGNPGDVETHRLVGDGVPFIQKPFGTNELGDMLRRVLDRGL